MQVILALEAGRDKVHSAAKAVTQRCDQLAAKLQERDGRIADLEKRIDEAGVSFREQQALYAEARAERNAVSKRLVQVQQQALELKSQAKALVSPDWVDMMLSVADYCHKPPGRSVCPAMQTLMVKAFVNCLQDQEIDQVKLDIKARDASLAQAQSDHARATKEGALLSAEADRAAQGIKEAEAAILTQKAELTRLEHLVKVADQVR